YPIGERSRCTRFSHRFASTPGRRSLSHESSAPTGNSSTRFFKKSASLYRSLAFLQKYLSVCVHVVPNQGQDRDGICRSWGQHHYETFDGSYFYYPGTCSYILAQDCRSATPQYTVWVHNSRVCEGSVYSCPRALSLFFPNEEEIHISGYQVHQGGRSLPQTIGGVFIERLADYLLVKSVFGFSLAWDGESGVYLKMSEQHHGTPCGLCGNYNNLPNDDLTTARGETDTLTHNSHTHLIKAHCKTGQMGPTSLLSSFLHPSLILCLSTQSSFHHNLSPLSTAGNRYKKCSALLFFPFLSCHDNIDPNPYVASCVADLCVSSFDCSVDDGCEESFVHRDCISCCPPTCTFDKECLGTNLHCLDGCYCPDGLILQNGTCIAVSQCPCVYHGTSYTQGHTLEQGCSVCVCMGGVWNCTENNCTVECSVVGDVFVTSFDGRMFLQPGACQYVLVKSRIGNRFTVTVQYTTCTEAQQQACIQSVTVVLDENVSHQVTLTREGEVLIGVNPVPTLPYINDVVEVQRLTSVFVQLRTLLGLRLQYDGRGGRIYLQLDSQWRGNTLGLCGTFNGNLRDDFLSPAGMIEGTPQLHANSWRVSSACSAPINQPIIDPLFYASLCEVLLGSVFSPCHGYVSPSVYQQQCRYQACRCGNTCLCTALAHYTYLCSKHHVAVNYRAHVSECGESGQLVLHRGECYYPENCPCAWLGLEYLPGETVDTPCYRCVCHRGYFNCNYSPCPAVCTVYSDRHYHTFDGLEYDYHSDCQVYLLKSIDGEVSIVAQNKDCYQSGIVCMKMLVIHVGFTKIYFNDNSGQPSPSSVVGKGSEFELWSAGYYTAIHFPKQDLTVLWDRKTTVHIRAGPQWKGLLSGLCGNFDSVTVNDMTTSSHMEVSNAQGFGDSWALGQVHTQSGTLNSEPSVDVSWFYRNCLTDTCNCNRGGDCECLCTSIAAYAHTCCQHGVTVVWRNPSVCREYRHTYTHNLGEGPFSVVSAVYNATVFGVNRTSGSVFPLVREFLHPYVKLCITGLPVVSLESAERPNYFLVVSELSGLRLEQWTRGEEFGHRASFLQHQGVFLTHSLFYCSSYVYVHNVYVCITESNFVIPYRMMCEWRYHACASPCVRTCSDPAATRCHFLPPVEGCFPRCPKNMVLDEVTRRCVYTEDCVSLPPTPTPYAFVNRTTTTPTTTTVRPTSTTTTSRTTTTSTRTTTSAASTSVTATRAPTTPSTAHLTESFTPTLTPPRSPSPPPPSLPAPSTPTVTEDTPLPAVSPSISPSPSPTITSSTTGVMTPTLTPAVVTRVTMETPSPTSPSLVVTESTTPPLLSPASPSPPPPPPATPPQPSTQPSSSPSAPPISSPTSFSLPPPLSSSTPTLTTAETHRPVATPTETTSVFPVIYDTSITMSTSPPETTESITTETATSPDSSHTPEAVSMPTQLSPFLLPTTPLCMDMIRGPIAEFLISLISLSLVSLCSLQPPYSYRVDECAELICFNGELLLHNSSLHCRYNTTPPRCSLLGMAVLTNTDPCCPLWQCPCRCSVMSDLRVITFDGNNVALYDNGSYILVYLPTENIIGTVNKLIIWSLLHCFTWTPFSQSPSGGTSGLCFKNLNITTPSYRIIINRLDRKVTITDLNHIKARLPFSRQALSVEDTGSMYLITTPGGVNIQWYHSTGIMVLQYTSLLVCLPGCCDGNPADDLKLPNGTVVREVADLGLFLQAWRVHTSEDTEHTRRIGDNCTTGDCSTCLSMLRQRPFTPCHSKVSPEQFCDVMWAGDLHYKAHQCDFLAAYVAVCYTYQVCINWRRHNFCPLRCPSGREYQACVSTCTTRTCQNREFYEETTCSHIREECVCRSGTILHRADSTYCVTEEQCVCTDNEGSPRAPGEVWNGSLRGCCLFRCLENGSVVAVEPDCSFSPTPLCEREGEYVLDVLEEGACCPKKICECNLTICESEAPPCENGNRLVIGYSALSCCPEYRCECDPHACRPVTAPDCREDQFLVEVREDNSCCYSFLCVCESCIEPVPACSDGEILAVNLNTTNSCCPQYHCGNTHTLYSTHYTSCTDTHIHVHTHTVLLFTAVFSCVQCHQLYVASSDPQVCCGSCKNVSCSFNIHNRTTEVFTAGSSWVDNCTRYDCVETAGGTVVLASGVVCPPFNDTECTQNGGVVQSYVDGCCRTCKEDGKTCKRVAIRTTIRKDDCRSNAPLTVYSCDGKCPSATIFNFNINSHARFCKCCRESGLQTRSVTLYCSRNATLVDYSFQEPLDCSCLWN
uniref:Otogelin-like protein n=1 Tax=Salmo trutta TaxID=8032 RepID=A0A674CG96_SALTR